ncbi:NAD-P-binding protein [Trametes versicolor FP-101664 SS1]|uniref:NAD-P-binding protein n=1 Tax=Trametes versicolor (strain FP-101664) TaxID=717944 RepID=UPI0004623A44|nr:NAD-P-binding protein [Trametes versicolor FP-101664 SS1]EIW63604.1 NAD-P-binding protein [Trametes versicolor FP-101664 SS1]
MYFYTLFTHRVLFPGKPSWTPDHLPDLSAKVAIVTGGNTGIGRETVKRLLMKNAKVYMAARSKEKAERAIAELHDETGKTALFLPLDLNDLKSVQKAVEEFKSREPQLDVLILNAGALFPSKEAQVTAQGYDATFGINVIGHFLLVRLLYPILSASGTKPDPSRIIWVSSMANHLPSELSYDAFRDGPARKKADPFVIYGESKLAAVMLSTYHARTSLEDNVASIAIDPGCIKSSLYRSSPWHLRLFDRYYWYPVEYGAVSSLYAAGEPGAAERNGKYLQPWARLAEPNKVALDVGEQEKLWTWLEEQVKPYL